MWLRSATNVSTCITNWAHSSSVSIRPQRWPAVLVNSVILRSRNSLSFSSLSSGLSGGGGSASLGCTDGAVACPVVEGEDDGAAAAGSGGGGGGLFSESAGGCGE